MAEITQTPEVVALPRRRSGRARARALLNNNKLFIFLTLLPAVVLLTAFIFVPIGYSVYLSLYKTQLLTPEKFVGLAQYADVFKDPTFWTALKNTLLYTAGSVALTLVLGLGAALILDRPLRGRGVVRTAMFLPYIIPYAAYALLWYWLFDPRYGLVNYVLGLVGIDPIAWLQSSTWVLPAFILMSVWKRLGFAMVLFLTGLQTIPRDLYDAASVDGATGWAKLRYVTLPLLSPITLFTAIISLIYSLQLFVEPLVMTHGGPGDSSQSLAYLLYQEGFSSLNVGRASVMAVLMCLLTFGFSLVLLRRFDVKEVYE